MSAIAAVPEPRAHLPVGLIEIRDRHRRDMGDLAALADSIRVQGLLQPIGVTDDNVLVFGERRLRACRDILGWSEIDVRIVNVTSLVEGERDENEVRKDFTVSERVDIGRAVEALVGERRGRPKARDDGPDLFSENPHGDAEFPENVPAFERGRETRVIAAERAGFGNERTYAQAKKVVDDGVPELVQAVDAGNVSVSAAATIARQDKDTQRRLVAEDKLKRSAAELRKAQQEAKEAEKLPKAAPLTDEQRARQTEVFGTPEDQAIWPAIAEIIKRVAEQPDPGTAALRIPPAIRHAVDTAAVRSAAVWLITFSDVWEKEVGHGREAAE